MDVVSDRPRLSTEAFDSADVPVRSRYDWGVTAPSFAVIQAVAAVTNRVPSDLPALYDAVDPDMLDAMCGREAADRAGGAVQVTFSYANHTVTVRGDGEVAVKPPSSLD